MLDMTDLLDHAALKQCSGVVELQADLETAAGFAIPHHLAAEAAIFIQQGEADADCLPDQQGARGFEGKPAQTHVIQTIARMGAVIIRHPVQCDPDGHIGRVANKFS